jgi:recombinational DNA repair ATPase RecF
MKIKSIRISGFRGIPPVFPPDVNIELAGPQSGPKDLLLFGPNAYGKSSIADALEWFFKENVRSSTYFEEYCSQDNVHVNLGKPNCQQNAFIELVLAHNGGDFTVRKELDCSGVKSSENLTGLQAVLEQAQDEIIVLDHDQFRNFISAANKDKWATFSSLIGYEELDHFRAGLDSVTTKSLTDHLGFDGLRKELDDKEKKWESDLHSSIQRLNRTGKTLDDLKNHFQTLLEVNLTSLSLEIPVITDISDDYWDQIHSKVKTPEDIVLAASRLSHLKELKGQLALLDNKLMDNLEELTRIVQDLAPYKTDFDKEVLVKFYRSGLQIMDENTGLENHCPFCSTPYQWDKLRKHVEEQHDKLNFSAVQFKQKTLQEKWNQIKEIIQFRLNILKSSELTVVKEIAVTVADLSIVEDSLSLEKFDRETIQMWIQKLKELDQEIGRNRKIVEEEIHKTENAVNNPQAQIQQAIMDLQLYWQAIIKLDDDLGENIVLKKKLEITELTIDGLRTVAANFRIELGDFTGRVAEMINNDVHRYFHVLHPNDDVVPELVVSISGTQRQVSLKCTYRGFPNRTAITLLSESHRNSLGMAIFLAFMKFKRNIGSHIEFCIFDDVTQSFDNEHRTNLIGLLENPDYPEIFNQQIIFMTHDRTLADLIKRPGEQNLRDNWIRVDIRNWWLKRMVLEAEHDLEPLNRARYYFSQNDEIAAGIYVRKGLEQIYKTIIVKTNMRIPYTDKPWNVGMEKYREYILDEVTELWVDRKGFIDPNDPLFLQLFTSQRILNLTVHDSQFLDNPMTLGDVQAAMTLVQQLKDRFTCQSCGKYYHTVRKSGTNNPQCKRQGCNNLLT